MKPILIFFLLSISLNIEAQCTGSEYCTTCTNCSRCRHCKGGGVCGVCSPGSFKKATKKEKAVKSSGGYSGSKVKSLDNNKKPAPVLKKIDPSELPADYDQMIYTIVEKPAEFSGGTSMLAKYISQNVKFPPEAKEKGIYGKCYLKFVVNTDGSIGPVEVLKGVSDCGECDQEAVQAIMNMPNWIPATMQGKRVRSFVNLPVSFKTK